MLTESWKDQRIFMKREGTSWDSRPTGKREKSLGVVLLTITKKRRISNECLCLRIGPRRVKLGRLSLAVFEKYTGKEEPTGETGTFAVRWSRIFTQSENDWGERRLTWLIPLLKKGRREARSPEKKGKLSVLEKKGRQDRMGKM